ncbi:hypothetical protein KZX50_14455 [Bacillus infantis]|uniref:hypothetical protein n=1 Tax=Bacillus infantis TaxID=324767 RepID=UPI000B9B8DE1|nr:hypothetical protein [Bacillus infantis]MCK6206643.1 hypothetical protein [Bacillus infantis]OXT16073.1 hypothetical protein B9K06_18050 [Bacillus sp. OG2]
MKFVKFVLIPLLILAALGIGVYYWGTNLASEKVMDAVSAELESSGSMEEVKTYIENDPELKKFVEEAESVDESRLPFTTKEQATRLLIRKVGISELQDIRQQVQEGAVSKEEVLQKLESNLTEEEILALKVVAYKEIYNQ